MLSGMGSDILGEVGCRIEGVGEIVCRRVDDWEGGVLGWVWGAQVDASRECLSVSKGLARSY